MFQRVLSLAATGLLLLLPHAAHSLASDREQPIHIRADRVTIDEARGTSTYQGDVELTQGSLKVQASRMLVIRGEAGLARIEAEGNPVRFRQRPDEARSDVHGSARRVEYFADAAEVVFKGDGRIVQNNDEFRGDHIVYDTQNNTVRASGGEGDGRVHVIIQPQRKEAADGR